MSSLEGASLDVEQRAAMATAAAAVLAPQAEPKPLLELADEGEAAGASVSSSDSQQQQQQGCMHYTAATPNSAWLTVLPLCAGFFDPLRGSTAAAASSRSTVHFAAAVWNHAPIDLPLVAAEVQLADGLGSFTALLLPDGSSCSSSSSSGSLGHAPAAVAGGGRLVLPAGTWQRMMAAIPVRCSGQLDAAAVTLRFGEAGTSIAAASSLTYQLPELLPKPQQAPSSPRAGRLAALAPAPAVGWLRGGWSSSQSPFSLAAG